MTRRFVAPASASTPIDNPTCAILGSTTALFVFPTGVDTAQYYVTGDAQTSVVTRSATTGNTFNSTEGQIETASNAMPSTLFTVPNGTLAGFVSNGPFTLIEIVDWDVSGGGPSSEATIVNQTNGTYGLKMLCSSGGGSGQIQHYMSGGWGFNGPSYHSSVAGEHFLTYRHQSGDQDYLRDTTALASGTTVTTTGVTYNSASYPLKVGASFYNGATRRWYWKGTIIVPSALTDTQISDLVGAAGLIVDEGTSTTKTLKVLVHPDAQSVSGVAGVVFEEPAGSDLTGAKIGEFTGATFEATLESGQAVLLVPVADFGGGSLTTSDTPMVYLQTSTEHSVLVQATVVEV